MRCDGAIETQPIVGVLAGFQNRRLTETLHHTLVRFPREKV